MPRLMSVSHTEQAVVDRTKLVTRRVGWTFLRPGDALTLCRKVMGRRRADGTVEPLVRLAEVVVVEAGPECLSHMYPDDVALEGVPGVTTRDEFIEFYCNTFGVTPDAIVTRIRWEYL